MKNDQLEEMLNFDALEVAEKFTGTSYKDSETTTALGMLLMQENAAKKQSTLASRGDTFFSMKAADFIALLQSKNFTEVSQWVIPGTEDKGYLFLNAEKTVLVHFNTFYEGVNAGNMYYEVTFHEEVVDWRRTSSGYLSDSDRWIGDHDIREAMFYNLSQLEEVGSFHPVSEWEDSVLLSPSRFKDIKFDRAIIAEFPSDIQAHAPSRSFL